MRSLMRKSVMFAGAFLLFAGANAYASDWNIIMEVKVPFPFVVKGQSLPAGRYKVEQQDGSTLLFHGEEGNHAVVFVTTATPASGQDPAGTEPALTFIPYENEHRLSSVWESGSEGWSVIGR